MNNDKKGFSTKYITLTGMLGAISAILMILEFPLPLAPTFIKMDFSDLPVILGGYMMGPVAGLIIILIKILLNFVFTGTVTAGVGEAANMIYSISYMLPAVIIYRLHKSKKEAVISLVVATLFASIVAVFVNTYITFPVYAKAFGMSIDSIVAMGTAINSNITDMFTLMLWSILPFNILKYGIVSIITFILYKKLKRFIFNI